MPKPVISDLYTCLLYPIKALISKNFYFTVLFRMRGGGLVYLLFLCVGLSFFAGVKGHLILERMSTLELPRLIAQMPPSYLNSNGVLSPNNSEESYKLLRNSQGLPAVVYNTENRPLEGDAVYAPLEFNSDAVSLKSGNNVETIPYNSIFSTDTNFDPFLSSEALDMVINASFFSIWAILAAWFFSALIFNALICAIIGKFLMLMCYKIRTGFASIFRLSAFSNTIVGLLMLLQFFVDIPLSFGIMALLPLVYILLFAREFRKELAACGMEAFKKKYARGGTFKGEAAGAGAAAAHSSASVHREMHTSEESTAERHTQSNAEMHTQGNTEMHTRSTQSNQQHPENESAAESRESGAPRSEEASAARARSAADPGSEERGADSASRSEAEEPSARSTGEHTSGAPGAEEQEPGKIGRHRPGSFEA